MSIATEIQRLQGIKSEIMAALERKNVDTTGKNISDVGDLIRSIEVEPSNIVHIGEHDYPFVKIGNLLWMTQNIREPIGTLNTDYRVYTGKEEEYGYYYKGTTLFDGTTVKTALGNIIPSGWRVPTKADFDNLIAANEFDKFDVALNGHYSGAWLRQGSEMSLWCNTLGDFDMHLSFTRSGTTSKVERIGNDTGNMESIRLVKDA